MTSLKKYGIKVNVAIGGWNDSEGDKYSRLVNNPSARRKFVDHVIGFIEKYNFDGLDLDWEYPSCWQVLWKCRKPVILINSYRQVILNTLFYLVNQVDCKEEHRSDKQGFAALVHELKEAFRPKGLLLSAAVSPSKKVIDYAYDVPAIAEDLDWISVMTYDYHGHWDKKTGHVAPMYHHPESEYDYFNTVIHPTYVNIRLRYRYALQIQDHQRLLVSMLIIVQFSLTCGLICYIIYALAELHHALLDWAGGTQTQADHGHAFVRSSIHSERSIQHRT